MLMMAYDPHTSTLGIYLYDAVTFKCLGQLTKYDATVNDVRFLKDQCSEILRKLNADDSL